MRVKKWMTRLFLLKKLYLLTAGQVIRVQLVGVSRDWMTHLYPLKKLYRDLVIRMQLSGVSRDKRLKNEHLICQE